VATSDDWSSRLTGVDVIGKDDPQGVLLAVTPGMDTQAVLKLAMAAGKVEHFGFESGSLADLYRQLVPN
jgi:hypothetical protein